MLCYGKVFLFALKRWEDDIKRMEHGAVVSVRVTRRVCLADAKRFMMAGNFQSFSGSSSWTWNHDRSLHWRSPRPSEMLKRHAEKKGVGRWAAKDGFGHGHIGMHRIPTFIYLSIIPKVKLVAVDSQLHSGAEDFYGANCDTWWANEGHEQHSTCSGIALSTATFSWNIFRETSGLEHSMFIFCPYISVIEHHSMHQALCMRPPPTIPNENECQMALNENRLLISLL